MSSVLVVDGHPYLIDAGPGASRRIHQAGIDPTAIVATFITHQHPDHISDLFSLFWLPFHAGTPTQPIPVFGPGSAGGFPRESHPRVPIVFPERPAPGIREVLDSINGAYAYETNISAVEFPAVRSPLDKFYGIDVLPPISAGATPDQTAPAMEPFSIYEDDRVRVSAILVPHGPVFPSFAFRFDTDYGSVAFSGDTSKSENVSRLATGCDTLIHEAIDIDYYASNGASAVHLDHLRQTHTTPQEVGEIAATAGVRSVVLSHLAPGDARAVTDASWEKRVRSRFRGNIVTGNDLTRMGVGRPR
ncbi:MBL fold metallo-hydrolase [Rhodococcus sp. BH2-1]|nr:MBL fold metallo-hydrolase [Rhodococcus sp. BH2-1]